LTGYLPKGGNELNKAKYLMVLAAGVAMTIAFAIPALAANPLQASTGEDSYGEAIQQESIPYPTDIQVLYQSGRNFLHKTFTVPADIEPGGLIQPDFIMGGYRYSYSSTILRETTSGASARRVTEIKTIESNTGDRAAIIAALGNQLPFSDDYGYVGELFLLPDTLSISEMGRVTYSYTVSDVRRFEGLSDNDMANIPRTVVHNGRTLQLQSVDWQVTSRHDGTIPTGYTAIARYSAPAIGTRSAGYIATATFSGEVSRELVGISTFTIVYEGEQVIIPFNHIPLLAAGLIIVGCLIVLAVLWKLRKNVEVYVYQAGIPELYTKMRVSLKRPIIVLRQLSDVEVRLVFDKRFAKRLMDQRIFVVSKYINTRFDLNGMRVVDLWLQGDKDEEDSND